MLQTYKATLRGNQLEWNDASPPVGSNERPIAVYVTILDDDQVATRQPVGKQMAAILAQLAQQPTLTAISDPVAWQKEQRGERTLPGRDT